MNLKEIVAVNGKINGLCKVVANRSNGLIVKHLQTEKKQFASSRQNNFTPLESISIYTMEEAAEMQFVFERMLEELETTPPIDPKSSKEELKAYFKVILPNYDEEQVYPRDMKRVIKWFNLLKEKGFLDPEEEAATEEEETAVEEVTTEEATTTEDAAE